MVRSMYSGVSGMRAHQTRMDTIGNNIANVNTYGFKGSRVTFRDIYYQSLRSASAGSASAGGTNPSQVGVGVQVGSVDVMQTRSTFTQTDMTMDLAIDGEGFFQVQDANGNKYFTRAGQLNFDSAGNLVDSKGNFVLGTTGDPTGKTPGSSLIQVALPAVNPGSASVKEKVNGVEFTISASNNTKDGNVGFSIVSSNSLPIGQKASAEVGPNGIVVTLNANETFANINDLNSEVNAAIEAYMQNKTGASHPAGTFTIACENADKVFNTAGTPPGLTGKQITSPDYSVQRGKVSGWTAGAYTTGGFTFKAAGSGFTANGAMTSIEVKEVAAAGADPLHKEVTVVINGVTYTGTVNETQAASGTSLILRNGTSDTDYIELGFSGWAGITETTVNGTDTGAKGAWTGPAAPDEWTATASEPSKNIGLASTKFVLKNGTLGGPQGIESLTGIQIGTDGVITGLSGADGLQHYIGRVDLATFGNPSGLSELGGTYFSETPNSGTKNITTAGQGGAGQMISGSLELSNVDLSREFADMITTQRGFQANSRIITVSDTLLEELINLKR